LEIGARRAKAFEAFICGERPAGFNADAGFEVEWEAFVGVVGMRVVEVEVESTMISNAIRELFMGFIGLLTGTWSSSSSAARFRFVDLNAVGSMFSASDSPRGCLLAERMAPIHVKRVSMDA
jgi:hypothetical protein